MPEKWKMALICLVHKKGNLTNCANYRGISLLNITYNVLSSILNARLMSIAENIIGKYQAGFRRNKSTTDQIFNLRQIIKKITEYNIDTHHVIVDFRAAYDM